MRTYCKVCGGKGSVPDPASFGRTMSYCGPNGETSPHVICPNCFGRRFVGEPDVRADLVREENAP